MTSVDEGNKNKNNFKDSGSLCLMMKDQESANQIFKSFQSELLQISDCLEDKMEELNKIRGKVEARILNQQGDNAEPLLNVDNLFCVNKEEQRQQNSKISKPVLGHVVLKESERYVEQSHQGFVESNLVFEGQIREDCATKYFRETDECFPSNQNCSAIYNGEIKTIVMDDMKKICHLAGILNNILERVSITKPQHDRAPQRQMSLQETICTLVDEYQTREEEAENMPNESLDCTETEPDDQGQEILESSEYEFCRERPPGECILSLQETTSEFWSPNNRIQAWRGVSPKPACRGEVPINYQQVISFSDTFHRILSNSPKSEVQRSSSHIGTFKAKTEKKKNRRLRSRLNDSELHNAVKQLIDYYETAKTQESMDTDHIPAVVDHEYRNTRTQHSYDRNSVSSTETLLPTIADRCISSCLEANVSESYFDPEAPQDVLSICNESILSSEVDSNTLEPRFSESSDLAMFADVYHESSDCVEDMFAWIWGVDDLKNLNQNNNNSTLIQNFKTLKENFKTLKQNNDSNFLTRERNEKFERYEREDGCGYEIARSNPQVTPLFTRQRKKVAPIVQDPNFGFVSCEKSLDPISRRSIAISDLLTPDQCSSRRGFNFKPCSRLNEGIMMHPRPKTINTFLSRISRTKQDKGNEKTFGKATHSLGEIFHKALENKTGQKKLLKKNQTRASKDITEELLQENVSIFGVANESSNRFHLSQSNNPNIVISPARSKEELKNIFLEAVLERKHKSKQKVTPPITSYQNMKNEIYQNMRTGLDANDTLKILEDNQIQVKPKKSTSKLGAQQEPKNLNSNLDEEIKQNQSKLFLSIIQSHLNINRLSNPFSSTAVKKEKRPILKKEGGLSRTDVGTLLLQASRKKRRAPAAPSAPQLFFKQLKPSESSKPNWSLAKHKTSQVTQTSPDSNDDYMSRTTHEVPAQFGINENSIESKRKEEELLLASQAHKELSELTEVVKGVKQDLKKMQQQKQQVSKTPIVDKRNTPKTKCFCSPVLQQKPLSYNQKTNSLSEQNADAAITNTIKVSKDAESEETARPQQNADSNQKTSLSKKENEEVASINLVKLSKDGQPQEMSKLPQSTDSMNSLGQSELNRKSPSKDQTSEKDVVSTGSMGPSHLNHEIRKNSKDQKQQTSSEEYIHAKHRTSQHSQTELPRLESTPSTDFQKAASRTNQVVQTGSTPKIRFQEDPETMSECYSQPNQPCSSYQQKPNCQEPLQNRTQAKPKCFCKPNQGFARNRPCSSYQQKPKPQEPLQIRTQARRIYSSPSCNCPKATPYKSQPHIRRSKSDTQIAFDNTVQSLSRELMSMSLRCLQWITDVASSGAFIPEFLKSSMSFTYAPQNELRRPESDDGTQEGHLSAVENSEEELEADPSSSKSDLILFGPEENQNKSHPRDKSWIEIQEQFQDFQSTESIDRRRKPNSRSWTHFKSNESLNDSLGGRCGVEVQKGILKKTFV